MDEDAATGVSKPLRSPFLYLSLKEKINPLPEESSEHLSIWSLSTLSSVQEFHQHNLDIAQCVHPQNEENMPYTCI
jgi:hypothetical protein